LTSNWCISQSFVAASAGRVLTVSARTTGAYVSKTPTPSIWAYSLAT
jgi:hypothetical protein